jgi:hypothetical protein
MSYFTNIAVQNVNKGFVYTDLTWSLIICRKFNILILSNFFKGCGRLWVADGIWKLMFAHCMMHRKVLHECMCNNSK